MNARRIFLSLVLWALSMKFCWCLGTKGTMNSSSLRSIGRVVTAHKQREGGGFIVRRPIGGEVSYCDPFLMLDHLGPATYGPGEAVGAPDHPHRGFETVTYILSGGMQHLDSAGNSGTLNPGWVQWMTAGRGVVHSEMPSDELLEKGGTLEGFQLWVNLPATEKMVEPRYQDTPPETIPVVTSEDNQVSIKVIAGNAMGTSAAIETRTPIHYLDITLQPEATYAHPLPQEFGGFIYCFRGSGTVGANGKSLSEGQAGILDAGGDEVSLCAGEKGMRSLLIAGTPINEAVARHGPFVMNTREELEQAFEDFQSGRLGGEISGREERYAKTQAAVSTQKKTGRWQQDHSEL